MPITEPMSTYTPGPWTVTRSGISVDAGPVRIRQEKGAWDDELRANARLIAAAPDLLETLVAVAAWMGSAEDGCSTGAPPLELIQHAIEKATNGQP